MDTMKILEQIAIPRPCHRESLGQVAVSAKELLSSWGTTFLTQVFALRPHAILMLGTCRDGRSQRSAGFGLGRITFR